MFVLYLWLEETVVKMPPDDRTASAPPAAVKSSIFTWPLTSNFAEGPVVPMPTLPELSILIRSLPPVDKLSALAPLDHIPVSKSPLKLMPGAPTAPKLNEPTPLTSNFEFGLVVPMPTLPELSIVTRLKLFVYSCKFAFALVPKWTLLLLSKLAKLTKVDAFLKRYP